MPRTNKQTPEDSQRALRHCITCRIPCGCAVRDLTLPVSHLQSGRYRDVGSARASEVSWGQYPSGKREERRFVSSRPRLRPTYSRGICTSRLCLNLEGTSPRLRPLERP